MTTTSYRVKFPGGSDAVHLAGIVDCPSNWHHETGPDAPGDRCVVVFSHCFTCNKDLKATVRISRALAHQGIAVLRYDMMGLGGSGGNFSESNFSTNLADQAAAIRFAHQELGPVTALLGHSFGGIASLVTAARAAQNPQDPPLQTLGFVATLAAPSDTAHLAELLVRMNPAIERDGAGEVTIGGVRWRITRQMLENFRSHDVPGVLPKIQCPVLLLHSPIDETVGIDHALRLMSLIQTDRESDRQELKPVSLVSLPGADHLLLNHPSDLGFVADLIASWCRRYRGDD